MSHLLAKQHHEYMQVANWRYERYLNLTSKQQHFLNTVREIRETKGPQAVVEFKKRTGLQSTRPSLRHFEHLVALSKGKIWEINDDELEHLYKKFQPIALELQSEWAHSGSRLEPEDWVAKYRPDKLADYKMANDLFEQVILERRARKAQQKPSESQPEEAAQLAKKSKP